MLAHRIAQQGSILETLRTIDYDLQHLENGCGQDGYKAAAADRDRRTPVICEAWGTGGVIQDAVLAASAKARNSRRNSRISRADRSEKTGARPLCIRACHH